MHISYVQRSRSVASRTCERQYLSLRAETCKSAMFFRRTYVGCGTVDGTVKLYVPDTLRRTSFRS